MEALELIDIIKEYRIGKSRFRALDGVSLKVAPGESVSIMGPSGSGKSTLLHFLGFLDRPTSGEALIYGNALSKLDRDSLARVRNGRIGFVFQSFNLAPTLSVLRNVELPMILSGEDRTKRRRRALELLASVGLRGKQDNLPSQLSGGEKQRVAIARSLSRDPDIILADEPTGNLDSASGNEVMEILHDLWKDGKTLVIVTHEPVVASYARRTIHVRDGKVERDEPNTAIPRSGLDIKFKEL